MKHGNANVTAVLDNHNVTENSSSWTHCLVHCRLSDALGMNKLMSSHRRGSSVRQTVHVSETSCRGRAGASPEKPPLHHHAIHRVSDATGCLERWDWTS